jgi:hypothetical protein
MKWRHQHNNKVGVYLESNLNIFRGEPVSFYRRKEFYYLAVTPVAKMSCKEKKIKLK